MGVEKVMLALYQGMKADGPRVVENTVLKEFAACFNPDINSVGGLALPAIIQWSKCFSEIFNEEEDLGVIFLRLH